MAHKSPFSKEIGDEWTRLVDLEDWRALEREPPSEQVEGWERLYARARKDGAWIVPAPDASLIAGLGHTIAFRQRRYEDAARIARQYLDHPDAPLGDDVAWAEMSVRFGTMLILIGNVEDGIRQFQVLLGDGTYPLQSRRHLIRNNLIVLLEELDKDESANPSITSVAATLLQDWKGQRSKARLASACQSNGELARVLESTYPMRKPDPE